jgi:exopolysaccharide biosynthesis polyprenyl glycosylphosphotransferase
MSTPDGEIKDLRLRQGDQIAFGSQGAVVTEGHSASLDLAERVTTLVSDLIGYDTLKRLLDMVGVLLLLIPLFPVMLFTALLVRVTSRGPVIFMQRRLTQGGLTFTMYKFRTMRTDAEKETGAVWASDNDPRITPCGKFLRKTRLDELPQLLNVITGDMSLIGPRPERPEFAKKLSEELPHFDRRLEVKAGLTGLAQVAAGYASDMKAYRRKLALDLIYVENRSLLLDLKIAIKTVFVVLTGNGAR